MLRCSIFTGMFLGLALHEKGQTMFFLSQSHFISMIPIVRKGIKIDYKLMRSISVKNEPLLSKERIVRHPRHHELNFMKYTTVKRSRFSAEIRKSLPSK